ncbi:MAG: hypothetical protein D6718_04730 [Acidobacteria bacterium]|nr:MAG: hypothetical protein D6718_04730 [Acidobacteriota bacterium]
MRAVSGEDALRPARRRPGTGRCLGILTGILAALCGVRPALPCIRCAGPFCKVDPVAGSLYCRTLPSGRCVDWYPCGEVPRPLPPPPVALLAEILLFAVPSGTAGAFPAVADGGDAAALREAVAASARCTPAAVDLRAALVIAGAGKIDAPRERAVGSSGSGFLIAARDAGGSASLVRVCSFRSPAGPLEAGDPIVLPPDRALLAPAVAGGRPVVLAIRMRRMPLDRLDREGTAAQRAFWRDFERNRKGTPIPLTETAAPAGCPVPDFVATSRFPAGRGERTLPSGSAQVGGSPW